MAEELTACGKCDWYRGPSTPLTIGGLEHVGCCTKFREFDPLTGQYVSKNQSIYRCNPSGHCPHFKAREPDSADDNRTA